MRCSGAGCTLSAAAGSASNDAYEVLVVATSPACSLEQCRQASHGRRRTAARDAGWTSCYTVVLRWRMASAACWVRQTLKRTASRGRPLKGQPARPAPRAPRPAAGCTGRFSALRARASAGAPVSRHRNALHICGSLLHPCEPTRAQVRAGCRSVGRVMQQSWVARCMPRACAQAACMHRLIMAAMMHARTAAAPPGNTPKHPAPAVSSSIAALMARQAAGVLLQPTQVHACCTRAVLRRSLRRRLRLRGAPSRSLPRWSLQVRRGPSETT